MNSKAYMMEELSRLWPELEKSQIEEGLEVPKDKKMGDLAFPCFRLAKTMHKAPNLIAQDLKNKLEGEPIFEKVEVVGPYLNMTVDKTWLAGFVLSQFDEAEKEGKACPLFLSALLRQDCSGRPEQ